MSTRRPPTCRAGLGPPAAAAPLVVGVAGLARCASSGALLEPDAVLPRLPGGVPLLAGHRAWAAWSLLMLHHLTGGAWGLLLRRVLEAGDADAAAAGAAVRPARAAGCLASTRGPSRIGRGRRPRRCSTSTSTSTSPFFLVRAAVYFVVWLVLAFFLNRWSREQDRDGDPARAAALPACSAARAWSLYGLTITFASIDWVMSLEPDWYSTIFRSLFAIGQMLLGVRLRRSPCWSWLATRPPLADVVDAEHLQRPRQPAAGVRHALGVHGVLPVPADLDRQPARRDHLVPAAQPRRLAVGGACCWSSSTSPCRSCCCCRATSSEHPRAPGRRRRRWCWSCSFVDLFWLDRCRRSRDGASLSDWLAGPRGAWSGVGGLWLACFLWQLRQPAAVAASHEPSLPTDRRRRTMSDTMAARPPRRRRPTSRRCATSRRDVNLARHPGVLRRRCSSLAVVVHVVLAWWLLRPLRRDARRTASGRRFPLAAEQPRRRCRRSRGWKQLDRHARDGKPANVDRAGRGRAERQATAGQLRLGRSRKRAIVRIPIERGDADRWLEHEAAQARRETRSRANEREGEPSMKRCRRCWRRCLLALPRSCAAPTGSRRRRSCREVGFDQRLDEQVPLDLAFRDEAGRDGHARRLLRRQAGHPGAGLLPLPDALHAGAQRPGARACATCRSSVGKDFDVVTVSFDPRETPELAAAKKQTYVERYGRPGAERGLALPDRRRRRRSTRLTEAVGFRYAYDPKQRPVRPRQRHHGADAAGQGRRATSTTSAIRRATCGWAWSRRRRTRSARRSTSVLLFCFHYDPATGKYTPAVMNFVRAGRRADASLALGGVLVSCVWRRTRSSRMHGGSGSTEPLPRLSGDESTCSPTITVWFPEQASTTAEQVDALFFFLLGVTGVVGLLVAVLLIYFAVRYRRRPGDDRTPRRSAASLRAGDVLDGHAAARSSSSCSSGAPTSTSTPARAAGRRPGGLRRRQAVDVEVPAPRAASARSTSCTSRSASRSS